MSLPLEVADPFIIIPDTQKAILTAWYEVLALRCDIDSIQFFVRSLNRSDDLSIMLLPVGDFVVWTCG